MHEEEPQIWQTTVCTQRAVLNRTPPAFYTFHRFFCENMWKLGDELREVAIVRDEVAEKQRVIDELRSQAIAAQAAARDGRSHEMGGCGKMWYKKCKVRVK